MLALFRPLCWCFMPWLYSGLYTEALYHGFILGFILGFMSLGRGVSVASVASGAVLATAGAHRGAAPQLGNSRAPGRAAPQQQQRQLRPQGIIQHYSLLSICFIHLCASVSQSVCPYSTQSIARPADRRAEHAWRAESFGSGRLDCCIRLCSVLF